MKTKLTPNTRAARYSFGVACAMTLVWQFGTLASSAQTGDYQYSGSETTITLSPGLYDITAFGAQGGNDNGYYAGGLGAEMSAQFNFSASTTLTLLVGGAGSEGSSSAGNGGGGGSFVVEGGTPLVIAGGGGGSGSGQSALFYGAGSGLTGSSGGAGQAHGYGGAGGVNGGGGGGGSSESGVGGAGGGGGFNASGGDGTSGVYGVGGGGVSFEAGGGGGYSSGGGVNGGYGGGGGGSSYSGGGGGGYNGGGGADGGYDGGGGGGGSIIDSSAIADLAEVSGIASPGDSPNGEIIITPVPEPTTLALAGLSGLSLLLFRRRRK